MNTIYEKTIFEPAKIEVITFDTEDILTTSALSPFNKLLGNGFEGEDDFFSLMELLNH